MTITNKLVSEEPIQQELAPDEPMHEENVEMEKVQEGLSHEEQEREMPEQLQSARPTLFEEAVHLSPAEKVTTEATQFKGQASSEGPILEVPSKEQAALESHEE